MTVETAPQVDWHGLIRKRSLADVYCLAVLSRGVSFHRYPSAGVMGDSPRIPASTQSFTFSVHQARTDNRLVASDAINKQTQGNKCRSNY